jgi:hypothetical protein
LAEEPEEVVPEDLPEEEVKKREEEKEKLATAETEEVGTMAKRKGYRMCIHGENFLKSSNVTIVFVYTPEEGQTVTQALRPIYKNAKCLAINVPDMGEEVPVGHHMLNLEMTLNGQ